MDLSEPRVFGLKAYFERSSIVSVLDKVGVNLEISSFESSEIRVKLRWRDGRENNPIAEMIYTFPDRSNFLRINDLPYGTYHLGSAVRPFAMQDEGAEVTKGFASENAREFLMEFLRFHRISDVELLLDD